MQVLEDLYFGDVRPSDRSFKRNSQYAKALDEVVRAGDALTDGLTEQQKELFEDYMSAQREVNVLTDCETFCLALQNGVDIKTVSGMLGHFSAGFTLDTYAYVTPEDVIHRRPEPVENSGFPDA